MVKIKDVTKVMYKVSRSLSKTACTLKDIEVLMSLDPKRIARRQLSKAVYRGSYKLSNYLSRKINKR